MDHWGDCLQCGRDAGQSQLFPQTRVIQLATAAMLPSAIVTLAI